MLAHPFVEEHEAVVIGAVAHEITARIAERRDILGPFRALAHIVAIGDAKAEFFGIEAHAVFHPDSVQTEVTQTADLERPLEEHAADVVGGHGCLDHIRLLVT